ncbi:hypothetical protein AGMMS50262_23280 [Bacteroidia bacterium]|nr:hypothetical protein AGMMS50262_23280 [Bacteroidia bacterium]
MISIIVSTYRKQYYEQLVQSIADTIGNIPYELVPIENHGEFSISKAYNLAAAKAKYPYLCFVHEDVVFETDNWGNIICEAFKKEIEIGAIGIAGGYKMYLPTGWGSGIDGWDQAHLYHFYGTDKTLIHAYPVTGSKVNVLDGVLIFTPRKVWEEFLFDETVEGFHFYDIDYTYRVSRKYKIRILDSLLITHFSSGNFGKQWMLACIDYHRSKKELFNAIPITKHEVSQIRNFYYSFSQPGMFTTKTFYKIRYVMALGIDTHSWKSALRFIIVNPFTIRYLRKLRLI